MDSNSRDPLGDLLARYALTTYPTSSGHAVLVVPIGTEVGWRCVGCQTVAGPPFAPATVDESAQDHARICTAQ